MLTIQVNGQETCVIRNETKVKWDDAFGACNNQYSISYGGTQFKGRLVQPRTSAVWTVISSMQYGWLGLKNCCSNTWSTGTWYWHSTRNTTDGAASAYPFPTYEITTNIVYSGLSGECAARDPNNFGKVGNFDCGIRLVCSPMCEILLA